MYRLLYRGHYGVVQDVYGNISSNISITDSTHTKHQGDNHRHDVRDGNAFDLLNLTKRVVYTIM